jgi:hypothetical protein
MNACAQSSSSVQSKFDITIWDYNYSMAYTIKYKITTDSLIINNIGGVQNESVRVILQRALTQSEVQKMQDFLSSFPIDNLRNEYRNPLVQDGDRKKVEIKFNKKEKIIELENVYQEDMDRLFNKVNQMLENDMKIRYEK